LADRTFNIRRLASDKKTISHSEYCHIHAMVTLPYRTLQSTLGCDTVIRRTWVIAAGRNVAFKIATKPLQLVKSSC